VQTTVEKQQQRKRPKPQEQPLRKTKGKRLIQGTDSKSFVLLCHSIQGLWFDAVQIELLRFMKY